MNIPVSDIHVAGGLKKWMEREARNVNSLHQIGSGLNKVANATRSMGEDFSKPQNRKKAVPTEHEEQVEFIKWARQNLQPDVFAMLFAIPNGGKRSKKTAVDLKAEGVKPGVPDLMLTTPRGKYHGLFIEMKRTKGGVVSKEQREMIAMLQNAGYAVYVCRGCDEAQDAMREYMFGQE